MRQLVRDSERNLHVGQGMADMTAPSESVPSHLFFGIRQALLGLGLVNV